MRKQVLPYAPAILWWCLTLYLFLLPGKAFGRVSWLDGWHADKLVHVALFGVLVWLFYRPQRQRWQQPWRQPGFFAIPLLALAYGVAIEYVQRYFVANRSFSAGDIVADAVGCLLPMVACWWLWRRGRQA